MIIQIVLGICIVILLGYVIYLHTQLAKKDIFIESTVRRLSGIEKSRSMEEMMTFLLEIQKSDQVGSFFKDRLLDDNTINFIFDNDKDLRIFMHYTKEEAIASSILADGFRFADSFYKTALPVSRDKLDMVIKHNSRKFFGEYLVIISISNDIVNFYSLELEKAELKNYVFENVLTEEPPIRNENSDLVYQLSSKFIKGYVNLRTGEILKNQLFDPWYNSPAFLKNIERLKN